MTLEQFEFEVTSACAVSPIVAGISTVGVGATWARLRAHLADGSFIEAFYNQATGKTAFALIQANQRILGADNTGSWHWHPRENPDSHIPINQVITFAEFLQEVEKHKPDKPRM